jgi:hypothetical protein
VRGLILFYFRVKFITSGVKIITKGVKIITKGVKFFIVRGQIYSHSKNVEIIDIFYTGFFFYKIQIKLVFIPKKTFLYF